MLVELCLASVVVHRHNKQIPESETPLPDATSSVASVPLDPDVSMKWPDLVVFGKQRPLGHVHPFDFTVTGHHRDLPEPMTVYVRFADHCFGEHANKSKENPKFIFPWCSSNTKDPRAFSPERYEFSPKLPGYVSTLQNAVVYQSNNRRNFVFQTAETNSKGENFAFYLNVKKASSSVQHHLEMNVVSCYPSSNHLSALGSRREKIRFKVLCGKIYRGEAVNFK